MTREPQAPQKTLKWQKLGSYSSFNIISNKSQEVPKYTDLICTVRVCIRASAWPQRWECTADGPNRTGAHPRCRRQLQRSRSSSWMPPAGRGAPKTLRCLPKPRSLSLSSLRLEPQIEPVLHGHLKSGRWGGRGWEGRGRCRGRQQLKGNSWFWKPVV